MGVFVVGGLSILAAGLFAIFGVGLLRIAVSFVVFFVVWTGVSFALMETTQDLPLSPVAAGAIAGLAAAWIVFRKCFR